MNLIILRVKAASCGREGINNKGTKNSKADENTEEDCERTMSMGVGMREREIERVSNKR